MAKQRSRQHLKLIAPFEKLLEKLLRTARPLFAAAVFLLLGSTVSLAEVIWDFPDELNGLRIGRIVFRTPLNLSYEDLMHNLPIRPGEPLRREELESAIESLLAREVFERARVKVAAIRSEPGAVRIRISLTPKDIVSDVIFYGYGDIDLSRLRRIAGLRQGASSA